jgi:glycosyltransferase involved in cell wall biosynthesis
MVEKRFSKIDFSIVVPVYRSEAILPVLVERLVHVLSPPGIKFHFELILINDASPDDSWKVIEQLAAAHGWIRGICLAKNVGQHNAVMAGLGHANGEIIIIMDDDLQHPPEAILPLLDAIKIGNDVCYTKYEHRQHELWKKIGSWINDRAATILLNKPAGLYLSSFKAVQRSIVKEIVKYDGPFAYVDGIILDITRRIAVITIDHQARLEGTGNYNFRRSVSLWLKMATSFSVFPLRIASVAGAAISVVSLFLIVAIIIDKWRHPEMPAGWASLAALILFMGGVQLLSLGIIGEYVGRSYLRLNRKPQYVIRSMTDDSPNGQ